MSKFGYAVVIAEIEKAFANTNFRSKDCYICSNGNAYLIDGSAGDMNLNYTPAQPLENVTLKYEGKT